MAYPADYFDSYDLKAASGGSLINEDVMKKIWDISGIPLPFTDLVGTDTCTNSYTEWTQDSAASVNTSNAVSSGADAATNNAAAGTRVGNHCQISQKLVEVTERAQSSDTIGRSNELAYQVMMRQRDLKRDVEAILTGRQASIADNPGTTVGKVGAFSSWLTSNDSSGTGGSATGFNTSTKVTAIPTAGEGRALTEVLLKDAVESVYLNNGNVTALMSVPQIIRRLNAFLNSSSAAVATPTANVRGEGAGVDQTAQGYVRVLITDFGTSLTIMPNRLQQTYSSTDSTPVDVCDVFLIDPSQVAIAYLQGYQTKPVAKLGLADRRQMSVDYTLKVYSEKAHAVIRDILPTSAVTAT